MNDSAIERRAIEWLFSDDTGSSSEAICSHMLGMEPSGYWSHPSDPADLGRCLRLLAKFPEWIPRISEMAQYGPGWAGQVEVWGYLADLMTQEVGIDWSKGDRAPNTFAAMKMAQANGYRNDPNYACTFHADGALSSASKVQ